MPSLTAAVSASWLGPKLHHCACGKWWPAQGRPWQEGRWWRWRGAAGPDEEAVGCDERAMGRDRRRL